METSEKQNNRIDHYIIAAARHMNPLDDLFFVKMAEDKAACEEIVSTILGFQVRVESVIPQRTIAGLHGRGVRLDALMEAVPAVHVVAELTAGSPIGLKGDKINVEVQKSNKDDYQRRARFNAAAITMNFTLSGTKHFRDIPDVCEIFISSFDLFGEGRVRYRINRVIEGSGTVVYNGLSEIYVNTAVQDRSTPELSNLTDLMEVFAKDGYNNKFPHFSHRKRQFKETEEGVMKLSEELQQLIDKNRQDAFATALKSLMTNTQWTIEKAMDALNIPSNQRRIYAELVSRT